MAEHWLRNWPESLQGWRNIDPKHDRSIPTNIDPGHDAVSPAELKKIKDSFPKHEGWFCPVCEVRVTEKTDKHWCKNCETYHSTLECYGEGDATNNERS